MTPESNASAVEIQDITHYYGDRPALKKVSVRIELCEMFGFVGPNGSGKSTLFRILSTLLEPSEGHARILGADVVRQAAQVREHLGVVFQESILDGKLTLRENLIHHGHYFGLWGKNLRRRIEESLEHTGLIERRDDLVEQLSGGLRRRGELAGSLLHEPRILLLDEPTAGLDPAARHEFWDYLVHVRAEREITILLTTHLMDEAERCDRLCLIHQGEVVALASPNELKSAMGYDVITIRCPKALDVAERIRTDVGLAARSDGEIVRIEVEDGHRWIARLVETIGEGMESITLSKPSIEDVFLFHTGALTIDGQRADVSSVGGSE